MTASSAMLAYVNPSAARLQDLVYDFEVPDNVFRRVYKEASRNHVPCTLVVRVVPVHFDKISSHHGEVGGRRQIRRQHVRYSDRG